MCPTYSLSSFFCDSAHYPGDYTFSDETHSSCLTHFCNLQALSAVVTSIEDHGYLLSFGIPAISGFLLRSNYMDGMC